jgi:hypothetical protein
MYLRVTSVISHGISGVFVKIADEQGKSIYKIYFLHYQHPIYLIYKQLQALIG